MVEHESYYPLTGEPLSGVAWLWHNSYYDGPTSGMVELADGTWGLAQLASECLCYDEESDEGSQCGWYRRFAVYQLEPEDERLMMKRHLQFQRYFGYHCDYSIDGKRDLRFVRKTSKQAEYWKKFGIGSERPTPDGVCVGWFEI